eukprot:TRINITY_DN595_c0_g1_i2.p1 TRINITY_DN595_c0_g1~~TRINITY_DN595_c0_g1_i2.p1  ORF type:complete len:134 (-),score=37.11 TRINITY_DN595_c0_g1_i2:153-554(-)
MDLIRKEQDKLKEFVMNQVRDQKDLIVQYVRKQQELEIHEKIKAKEQLEKIIEENNKRIAAQQEKLTEIAKDHELERLKELEKINKEKEEQKRKEDEARLKELEKRQEIEDQKNVIVNKGGKSRPALSFTLFG